MAALFRAPGLSALSALVLVLAGAAAVQAGSPADAGDRLYVTEYDAVVGDVDKIGSTGIRLFDVAAILQQDRFNVHERQVRQMGDGADSYFVEKAHRAEFSSAIIAFDSEATRTAILGGNPSLAVVVHRRGDGRLEIAVRPSGGEPAGGPRRPARPAPEIPRAFHGTWALAAADCRAGASAGIITIDAAGLHQAEAEMSVLGVLPRGHELGLISVSARNSAGGEAWDSTEELALSGDGRMIEWRRIRPDPGPLTRLYRCR